MPKGYLAAPGSLLPVDFRKLSEEQIKALRYHIGGAGLDPYNLKVVDGYALDLDGDGRDEKVLRAQYKENEVALVLDTDDKNKIGLGYLVQSTLFTERWLHRVQ